jgi:hypothetical protein
MTPPRIGIDFGGVVVRTSRHSAHDTDIDLSGGTDIAQEGVIEAVRGLVEVTDGCVWIVSKAGASTEAKTRGWLKSVGFFASTGMNAGNVRFCRTRPDKAPICRELGITHFIDDKIHVMQILRETVPHLFLFGDEVAETNCPPWATHVRRWSDVPALIGDPAP